MKPIKNNPLFVNHFNFYVRNLAGKNLDGQISSSIGDFENLKIL